ncbi:uncharacterized protein K452DRAFT_292315, partial [Aplosporella prunicola CBS 121167]
MNNFIYYLEGSGKSGLYKKGTPRYPAERKVLKTYEAFNAIRDAHLSSNRHSAQLTTFKDLQQNYYGVTEKDVEKLLRLCRVCAAARHPPPAPRALRAILSREIFERV